MRAQLANRALTMRPAGPAPDGLPPITDRGPTPATAPSANPMRTTRVREDSVTARDVHDEPRDWLSWSIAGTGVAALGASGVLFYQGARLNSQARSELDARARNDCTIGHRHAMRQ